MTGALDLRLKLGMLRTPTRISPRETTQHRSTWRKRSMRELTDRSSISPPVVVTLTSLEFPERIASEIDLLLEKAVA
jgi:hypothetical protein